jgi:hypothetical protein
MHLQVRLPKIEPLHIETPTRCLFRDRKHRKKPCTGTHFKAHQSNCRKPVRDTRHSQVTAQRYRCLKCRRTFRVYPTGVSKAHQSDTLKGLSVLLYILGLGYQAVTDLLDALQYPLGKTTVCVNVQAAAALAIRPLANKRLWGNPAIPCPISDALASFPPFGWRIAGLISCRYPAARVCVRCNRMQETEARPEQTLSRHALRVQQSKLACYHHRS